MIINKIFLIEIGDIFLYQIQIKQSMSRPLRIEYPNAFYHVMNRGAARKNIFHNSLHFELFYDLLEKAHDKFKIEIHAFCLMNNHYHLLIKTPTPVPAALALFKDSGIKGTDPEVDEVPFLVVPSFSLLLFLSSGDLAIFTIPIAINKKCIFIYQYNIDVSTCHVY